MLYNYYGTEIDYHRSNSLYLWRSPVIIIVGEQGVLQTLP